MHDRAVTLPAAQNMCGRLQVFNVVPTFLEVSLVAGILAYKCGPAFAGLTGATITLYTLVTFAITSVSSHPLLVGASVCHFIAWDSVCMCFLCTKGWSLAHTAN